MPNEKVIRNFIVKLWSENGDNLEWHMSAHRLDEVTDDFEEQFGATFLIKFQYCRVLEVQ